MYSRLFVRELFLYDCPEHLATRERESCSQARRAQWEFGSFPLWILKWVEEAFSPIRSIGSWRNTPLLCCSVSSVFLFFSVLRLICMKHANNLVVTEKLHYKIYIHILKLCLIHLYIWKLYYGRVYSYYKPRINTLRTSKSSITSNTLRKLTKEINAIPRDRTLYSCDQGENETFTLIRNHWESTRSFIRQGKTMQCFVRST